MDLEERAGSLALRYHGLWGIEVSCHRERPRIGLRPEMAAPIDVVIAGRERITPRPGSSWQLPLRDGRTDRTHA